LGIYSKSGKELISVPYELCYKDIRKDFTSSFIKKKTGLKPSFLRGDFKSVVIFVVF
jgi:hypothetical protein